MTSMGTATSFVKTLSLHTANTENEMYRRCWKNKSRLYEGAERWCVVPKKESYVIKIGRDSSRECHACEAEKKRYEAAKAAGLDRFFAEPLGSIEYRGSVYYVYKKVSRLSQAQLDNLKNDCKYSRISRLSNLIPSEKDREKLDDFCIKNDIWDLHIDNFGLENGLPVIFDYAAIF